MLALRKLQRAFAADVWGDDLRHMRGLVSEDQLSAARRFSVYRNNFQSSLIGALAATYPVVKQLVGAEFFSFMADRYIRAHPSRCGDLHNLGYAMAVFLERFQAVSKLPYIADIARLEWAYHIVFHAAAPRPFEPDTFAKTIAADSGLQFDLGPASRLLHSAYPIFRIWEVNQEGYAGEQTVSLHEGPESVLVIRPERDVELWRVSAAEYALLKNLAMRSNLDTAVEASLRCSPDFDLQASLSRFLSSGALVLAGKKHVTLDRALK